MVHHGLTRSQADSELGCGYLLVSKLFEGLYSGGVARAQGGPDCVVNRVQQAQSNHPGIHSSRQNAQLTTLHACRTLIFLHSQNSVTA